MIEEEKGTNNEETPDQKQREDIFSKIVRAGKRTYFFDVKATRKDDYYLTITESKKRFNSNGRYYFEKHKIFLYKEDFDKFSEALTEIIDYIKENNPAGMEPGNNGESKGDGEIITENYKTDVQFEDLSEEEKVNNNQKENN
ncbi:MAG: DUF3276 family protein [Bacteroidota bacterium]